MATEVIPSHALLPSPPPHTEFTIGWICVLKEEYRAAVNILDERYDTTGLVRGKKDKIHYALGRVGKHNVMINPPPVDMYGQVHASRIARDMRSTFPRMRFALLVGIAAGGGGVSCLLDTTSAWEMWFLGRTLSLYLGQVTRQWIERTGMPKSPPRELLEMITFLEERIWSEHVFLEESVERIQTKIASGGGSAAFVRPAQDWLYIDGFVHRERTCDCLQAESRQQVNLYS